MTQNYTKKLMTALALFIGLTIYSQDIHFTFANAQNTNDGTNDFYEVDVMLQTINTTGTFKLGSGQLYFNYNTLAFGENVSANSRFTVTQTNPDYIVGQFIDAAAASIYGPFTINDNIVSRVSWAFSQTFASYTFAADNVTETPTKLCHLKFQYIDITKMPTVLFEDGVVFDDQFFTACGPDTGVTGFETADCGANPGAQLLNDTFDSSGATLSAKDFELLTELSVYPNPTSEFIYISSSIKIEKIIMFDVLGKQVLSTSETSQLKVGNLQSGLYFLKLFANNGGSTTKKIVIE